MRLRQGGRRALSILALAFLALLAWLLWPRTAPRDRLIEAMWAEERDTNPRPSHVSPPLPGSFGELLEPHIAGLAESVASYKQGGAESMAQIGRIYSGKEPVAKLGPEPLHNLALHRRALEGALRATHAESARGPPWLRLFGTMRPGDPFLSLQHAARLAALDILILLDQGRVSDAAMECADILALARDVSYPSVLGRMIGVAMSGIVAPACGRALSAASPEALERIRAQLTTIRAGIPRFARILHQEQLFREVSLIEIDPRMPESGKIAVADLQDRRKLLSERLFDAVFRETAWAPIQARMTSYQDAQRLGWQECAARTEEVTRQFEWNPFAPDTVFAGYLRRHRDSLIKLDVLICVASAASARARTGVLPSDAAATCPPPEPTATCGEQSAPLRIIADGRGSRVSATLSDGSDYSVVFAEAKK